MTNKIIIPLLSILLFSGCSMFQKPVPITMKFPDNPGPLTMQSCPNLKKLDNAPKLSDVATTVSINYETYYDCAIKVDGWIEWYNTQKIIFESVK